jgi:hypothetical protein
LTIVLLSLGLGFLFLFLGLELFFNMFLNLAHRGPNFIKILETVLFLAIWKSLHLFK